MFTPQSLTARTQTQETDVKAPALPAELSLPTDILGDSLTKYVRKFDWFCRSFSTPHKNTNSIRQVCPLLTLLLLTVMAATSQEGWINLCCINTWMNDQRDQQRDSGLLAPAFFCSFFHHASATPPTLTNSPILPCLFQVLLVGPEVRGTEFWVSPLANYVNEASYILYFAWFLHLQSGMTAISIAEGTTYEKEHVYKASQT